MTVNPFARTAAVPAGTARDTAAGTAEKKSTTQKKSTKTKPKDHSTRRKSRLLLPARLDAFSGQADHGSRQAKSTKERI